MQRFRLPRGLLAGIALVAFAGSALADATIDGTVEVSVKNNRKVTLVVPVTMSNPGTVSIAGTFGQIGSEAAVNDTKKFKTRAGKQRSKNIKFKVDAKKLGITDATDVLLLQLQVTATETDQAEPAVALTGTAVPPPLMFVPGLANELNKGSFDSFLTGLNASASTAVGQTGPVWQPKGKSKMIAVYHYNSLSDSISKSGQKLAKKGAKLIKKSPFGVIDLICHNTGGVVGRSAMVPVVGAKTPATLAGKVRHFVMYAVPNSGVPLAYLAQQAVLSGDTSAASAILGQIDSPSIGSLGALLLNENFLPVVEGALPTFAFARVPGDVVVDIETLTANPGPSVNPPLDLLNGVPPDAGTTYTGFCYTSVHGATGPIQTPQVVDLQAFLAGGGTDLSLVALENGDGDGLVLLESLAMNAHPSWAGRINVNPIPIGTAGNNAGWNVPDDSDPSAPGYFNDLAVGGFTLNLLLNPIAPN